MAGVNAHPRQCPTCGGRLVAGPANIPFMLAETVVLIKAVPAEVCQSCHEAFTFGAVTDRVTALLNQMSAFTAEIAVIAYTEAEAAKTAAATA